MALSSEQQAINKLMDLLARRSHSVKELRAKLGRKFPQASVEWAIARAEERGWLRDPVELAAEVEARLNRKNKGYRYIRGYLRDKGLPTPDRDRQLEIDKARRLLPEGPRVRSLSRQEQARLARKLALRGFDEDVIRAVLF